MNLPRNNVHNIFKWKLGKFLIVWKRVLGAQKKFISVENI